MLISMAETSCSLSLNARTHPLHNLGGLDGELWRGNAQLENEVILFVLRRLEHEGVLVVVILDGSQNSYNEEGAKYVQFTFLLHVTSRIATISSENTVLQPFLRHSTRNG